MELTIQSLHFTSNQELNNFVTEKVSRLSHHSDKIESAFSSSSIEAGMRMANTASVTDILLN